MPSPTDALVPPRRNDLKKRAAIAAGDNDDTPNAAERYLKEMKRYQNLEEDDEYIMTITDTEWRFGNPTGVTTSSNKDTTVTLLFFTRTTLLWYDPDANFDQSTVVSVNFPTLTTITTTRDESRFSEEETSSPTTESESELESETEFFTTVLQTTTTSDTSITASTETSEGASNGTDSDLSQGGIIGISVGISIFSIAAAMLMLILFRRHHHKKTSPAARDPPKMEEARPAQQAAPRQYQAYHPSYTQNPRTSQGFIAELPAEIHSH